VHFVTLCKIKFFLLFPICVFLAVPIVAYGTQTTEIGSLKDECAKTFKEVEDMFEYHNTLELLGNSWGDNLDRAMRFLDWCVKHDLIKIK
jgi:hypothetical protein